MACRQRWAGAVRLNAGFECDDGQWTCDCAVRHNGDLTLRSKLLIPLYCVHSSSSVCEPSMREQLFLVPSFCYVPVCFAAWRWRCVTSAPIMRMPPLPPHPPHMALAPVLVFPCCAFCLPLCCPFIARCMSFSSSP